MKVIRFTVLLITLICITTGPVYSENSDASKNASKDTVAPPSDYIIGPGDVLEISVWKDEAMTKMSTVLPDGKISFPLVGEIRAHGKTVAQLKKEMEGKINRYVPNPVLHVAVQQAGSMLIYVIGRVNHPGRFAFNANINVMQALATAGGLNHFAKRNKIKIFREKGKITEILKFKYDDVSKGKNLEQNIRLKRGDVIVVP